MKNKKILIGACSLLMCATMVGCKPQATLQKITAELSNKQKAFKAGDTITKEDITVRGYYSNNETQLVTNWSCDLFKDNKYTFVDGDVGKKEFTITYESKQTTLSVDVGNQTFVVTFKDNDKVLDTKEVVKGSTVSEPETKFGTKEKVFDGWYVGDTKYDFTQPVTSNLTIETKYVDFTDASWKEAVDSLCIYDKDKNFTLKFTDHLQKSTVVKTNKNLHEILENGNYKYQYEDGVNTHVLSQETGDASGFPTQYGPSPIPLNTTFLYDICCTIKIGFYNSFSKITFNETTKVYTAEEKVQLANKWYKGDFNFSVVNGKLKFKDLNVYSKTTEAGQYAYESTYNFYDYGTTKLNKELTPTNIVTLEQKEAGVLSKTISAKDKGTYYVSFAVPEDADTSTPFNLYVKSGNDKIKLDTLVTTDGRETYSEANYGGLDTSINITVDEQSTDTDKMISFAKGDNDKRFSVKVTLDPNGTKTYENAEFYVEYTFKKVVSGIEAKLKTEGKTYKVGNSITKDDIVVTIKYKDGSSEVTKDWTCDSFTEDSYTFLDADIGEKEFVIKSSNKQTTLKVGVVEISEEADKFFKLYKPYNDTFQSSSLVYDKEEISYIVNGGSPRTPENLEYTKDDKSNIRRCFCDNSFPLAGGGAGMWEINSLKNYVVKPLLDNEGYRAECLSDETTVTLNVYDKDNKKVCCYQFNQYGYLVDCLMNGDTIQVTYTGAPHEKKA